MVYWESIGKYFIAYLLTGQAKRYHEALTRELTARYAIFPLHTKSAPHITIKPPFETDEEGIKNIERVLRSFAHNAQAVPLTIKGFGHMGFKTVYLDVYKSSEAITLVRRLLQVLNTNIPELPQFPHEGKKLHASVARFLDRKQSRRILRYLKNENPLFKMTLDNISILRKEGSTWKTLTTVPLQYELQNTALSSQQEFQTVQI